MLSTGKQSLHVQMLPTIPHLERDTLPTRHTCGLFCLWLHSCPELIYDGTNQSEPLLCCAFGRYSLRSTNSWVWLAPWRGKLLQWPLHQCPTRDGDHWQLLQACQALNPLSKSHFLPAAWLLTPSVLSVSGISAPSCGQRGGHTLLYCWRNFFEDVLLSHENCHVQVSWIHCLLFLKLCDFTFMLANTFFVKYLRMTASGS